MVFYVRGDQTAYLAMGLTSGYASLKTGLRGVTNLIRTVFGSQSLESRISQFHNEFLVKEDALAEIIFGKEPLKDRLVTLRKGVMDTSLGVISGFFSSIALTQFNKSVNQDTLDDNIHNLNVMQSKLEGLSNQFIQLEDSWNEAICYNENLKWESVPTIKDCLSHSLDDMEYQSKKIKPLSEAALVDLDSENACYNSVSLLAWIKFFRVRIPQQQLFAFEHQYKHLLQIFNKGIEALKSQWEKFISEHYLGSWQQLGIAKLITFDDDLICNSIFYKIFEDAQPLCSIYKDKTRELQESYKKLVRAIPRLEKFEIECKKLDFNNEVLGNLSLPSNFLDLFKEGKFTDIAFHFVNNGGIERFNLPDVNFDSQCSEDENKFEKEYLNDDETLRIYAGVFRATIRDLNSYLRWLNFEKTVDTNATSETVQNLFSQMKRRTTI